MTAGVDMETATDRPTATATATATARVPGRPSTMGSCRGPLASPAPRPSRGDSRRSIAACLDCDALQTLRDPLPRMGAACFRCGGLLVPAGSGHRSPGLALALALAAIPLFIAATTLPLLRMDSRGQRVDGTVLGAVGALLDQRLPALATLVLLTTVLLPALQLAGTVYLLLAPSFPCRTRSSSAAGTMFQILEAIRPWTQIEILLFGIVVAFGRLSSVFHMTPGAGLLCMAAFLLLGRGATAAAAERARRQ